MILKWEGIILDAMDLSIVNVSQSVLGGRSPWSVCATAMSETKIWSLRVHLRKTTNEHDLLILDWSLYIGGGNEQGWGQINSDGGS